MHDCSKIKDSLIDLLFDELDFDKKRALMVEINSCAACLALYRDMKETLDVFDQVAEEAMPQESFWTSYEKRLAARLEEAKVVRLWRLPAPAAPLALAASLLLVALSFVAWLALSNRSHKSIAFPQVKAIEPSGAEANQSPKQKSDEVKPRQKRDANHNGAKTVSIKQNRRRDPKPEIKTTTDAAQAAFIYARAAEHIEQAELLLRSFRNARAAAGETAIDISFEKRQARQMLDLNSALRREAEATGHRRVEELLSNLEPFLLDIANLPDLASKDEIDALRSVLGESSIITDLQLHSLMLMSRGL
jgi:hypothetical protein